MIRTVTKGIRRVFKKGPVDTARWAWYHFYERAREHYLGIETESCDDWQDSFADENYHVYQPLCYSCIDTALSRLDITPGEDAFLDYGSGKGRIVSVAATYPFKRVLGVELLADLNDIARENIRRAEKRLKCRDVEFIETDATKYELPGDITVLFLFNPFLNDVLKAVQHQIRKSLDRYPRRVQIVYMNPLENEDLFAECEWLRQREELPVGRWEAMRFRIYENRR
ncbi:MAG: class I SAM-dependent methyltransferase [Planctomycetaceae bacterium]